MSTEAVMTSETKRSIVAPRHLGLFGAAFVLVVLAILGAGAQGATADEKFEIRSFTTTSSDSQAGGHPNILFKVEFDNHFEPFLASACGCNDVSDITVNLPEGLIANPHATPQCTRAQHAGNLCSPDSQIGRAFVAPCLGPGFCFEGPLPLYNLIPTPDQAGLVGFKTPFIDTPVFTEITARTDSDYGLVAITKGITRVLPIKGAGQEIWGVPADPSHDAERYLTTQGGPANIPSNSPRIPFTQNPTTCGLELQSTVEVVGHNTATDFATAPWPATTGCSQLSFNPSLVAKPTTTIADTPSGLDVDLTVPQTQSPTTPAPSEIRDTTVVLPEGISVNPNAADGKLACTDEQARFGTRLEAQCPEFAKIGTLVIHSAVLPDDMLGAVYIGEPKPGERYRLILTADGFGVHVKLPGTVTADPVTGRLTTSFKDLPQFPFERFSLHFFGAERGLLASPTRCGNYAVDSTFVPWNGELPTQKSTQFFNVSSGPGGTGCPGATRPFTPTFRAASTGNTAGAFSPFGVRFSRPDGDQYLNAVTVTTPRGFSAKLAGVPYCPEAAIASLNNPFRTGLAEAAAPACPAASQIGTAVTGAGAGTSPVYVPGNVYLAGPYKGAPLSLVVVIPAISGPYDLGNVAVRAAVHVDPVTARVTTVSDPLPHILEGIPLRARHVHVDLTRPEFALNPTNCSPLSVSAHLAGDEGALATSSAHYQVANCSKLDFAPALKLILKGKKKRLGHPALRARLTPKPGHANIGRVAVSMPPSILLENAHIGTVCNRVQFAARSCPADSVYGFAIARSPLLDAPVSGPVYLKSSNNPKHTLPDIAVDLRGQVDFTLIGRVDSRKGGIRTIFNAPDVPVSSFELRMKGGDKGLLVNGRNLCRKRGRADVRLRGQNGIRVNRKTRLTVACGKSQRKARR